MSKLTEMKETVKDNESNEVFSADQQLKMNGATLIEQINRQKKEIEDEVRKEQALVAQKELINVLLNEYDRDRSAEYHQKSKELAKVYSSLRRIRGDGCCFYRALLCAQLEYILNDSDELIRFTEVCKGWRQRLIKLGFPEFTTNDFCDWFDELLDDIAAAKYNENLLVEALNEEGRSNYYVTFFRLIASGYLRENAADYEGFIDGGRTMEQFCQSEIEPMFKDCDHLAIIALTKAIGVSIRIEYMDRTAAPHHGWFYDFIVNRELPKHFFLYRPGHYDIIYKK
uniref:Ubiquitin thioesterase n=1 Tax=Onchocerca volvulus TaxID=6282 RepID=A0A8R1Y1H9_ONCVO